MDKNRDTLLSQYASVEDFKENFDKKNEILDDFVNYAEENDIEKKEEEIEKSKVFITIRLKALIARNLWDTSAFFQIANDVNDSYLKAIEIIYSINTVMCFYSMFPDIVIP